MNNSRLIEINLERCRKAYKEWREYMAGAFGDAPNEPDDEGIMIMALSDFADHMEILNERNREENK